jgi:hypothetical protein
MESDKHSAEVAEIFKIVPADSRPQRIRRPGLGQVVSVPWTCASKHSTDQVSEKLSERCLPSSQGIPPVRAALVRSVAASSAAGGSLETRHRLHGLFGPVWSVWGAKGGGKAGGASWLDGPAGRAGGTGRRDGLAVRMAFRQAGSPPSKTARMIIHRKRSLACSTSFSAIRGSREFRSGLKNDLDPPRRYGRGGNDEWTSKISRHADQDRPNRSSVELVGWTGRPFPRFEAANASDS